MLLFYMDRIDGDTEIGYLDLQVERLECNYGHRKWSLHVTSVKPLDCLQRGRKWTKDVELTVTGSGLGIRP